MSSLKSKMSKERRAVAEPWNRGDVEGAKRAAKSAALEKKSGKTKYFVGHSNAPYKREVFGSKTTPTKETHPQYGHVRSGFKSKKDAEGRRQEY